MRSKSVVWIIHLVVLVVISPVLRAGGAEGSKEVGALISEAQRAATQAWWAAADMQQYHFSRVGWETHTTKLTEIKGLINTVAQRVPDLNKRWSEASPAQQQEIERITRALVPLVASYETTLGHLRENQQAIDSCVQSDPHYQALLKSNTAFAAKLAQH